MDLVIALSSRWRVEYHVDNLTHCGEFASLNSILLNLIAKQMYISNVRDCTCVMPWRYDVDITIKQLIKPWNLLYYNFRDEIIYTMIYTFWQWLMRLAQLGSMPRNLATMNFVKISISDGPSRLCCSNVPFIPLEDVSYSVTKIRNFHPQKFFH